MIKLQDLTPEVYYRQSRDFQFIGRLYDVVLNYIKTNADNLYNLPVGPNMNEQLLTLLSMTLGFKPKNNYNSKQLLAICSVLPEIMRHKGSLQSMLTAVNALLAAEEIKQALDYSIEPKKNITLYISQQLSDLTLLADLFDYILPAGMNYRLVKENQIVNKVTTNVEVDSKVSIWSENAFGAVIGNAIDNTTFTNRGITHGIATTIPNKVEKNKSAINTTLLYSSATINSTAEAEEETTNE